MRTRLILIAATWAAVIGVVSGSADAQSASPPGGQFVLVGVVILAEGRGLAWVQEPNFTNNKVVTVRLGDSVGPYRVTKILTHQVELTGPGGTIAVPLAGLPGAVGVASTAGTVAVPPVGLLGPLDVASRAGTVAVPRVEFRGPLDVASSAGTVKHPADETLPHPALNDPNAIVVPRGDPRREFPVSKLLERRALGSPLPSGVAPKAWPWPVETPRP